MSVRSLYASAGLLVTALAAGACGGPRAQLVFDKTIPLPGARFAGPVTVEVPRRDAYGGRDLEYVVELEARCTPALQIGYPDGEVGTVGARDRRWQDLLSRRAAAGATASAEATAPAEATADARPAGGADASATPPTGAIASAASDAGSAQRAPAAVQADAGATTAVHAETNVAATATVTTGRWERVATESWPGQLQFQSERERRCHAPKRWSRRYLTGLDETGQITVWADTPQELEDARLTVRVYAIGDVAAPPAPAPAPPRATVTVRAAAEVRARPPQPAPRRERPGQAQVEGAIWRPGRWHWIDGRGEWVWVSGTWGAPATTPPLKEEDRGALPAPGARWKSGYWVWVSTSGSWQWEPGEWLAPPKLVENPGPPPVPEQDWVAGLWVRTGATFTWKPGHWGRPRARAETPPPPPAPGARWVAGTWIRNGDRWRWSPGYYDRVGRPPPPPRAETSPARPVPDAVWLAGFWRWDAARNDYAWVSGYWELPPGEGYVWVWDEVQVAAPTPGAPSAPSAPAPRRTGRWILKIDLDVQLGGRARGGRR